MTLDPDMLSGFVKWRFVIGLVQRGQLFEQAQEYARKAAAFNAMRRSLLELAQGCSGDDGPDCPTLPVSGKIRKQGCNQPCR